MAHRTHRSRSASRAAKRWRAWGWLIPLALAILLYFLLPLMPRVTEAVFSRGLFRWITCTLGFLISKIPVSLTELALLAILLTAAALLVFGVVALFRHRRRPSDQPRSHALRRALRGIAWSVSCLLFAYMLLHGANYYRLTAYELLDLPQGRAYTNEQVLGLCQALGERASQERVGLAEDEDGCMKLSASLHDTLRHGGDGYDVIDDRYPFLHSTVGAAKPVLLSHLWSYTGMTGVYCPVLLETNVNIDQSDFAIPFTAAHELAHIRGFAREDECNFFAALACFEHPSADYRYSGYIMAYIYTYNELYRRDPALCAQADAHCSEAVLRDLYAQSDYWDSFEGGVQDLSQSLNDSFIESQRVEDGAASYDRVVDLLLAPYYA